MWLETAWWWTNAEKIGGLSQLAMALVALLALIVAVAQIRSARRQQKEATAYAIYSEQLRLDLQYPQYSQPDLAAIRKSGCMQQYGDYVSHVLYSSENILEVSSAVAWRGTVLYCMRPHAVHIRDHVLQHAANYNDEVVQLMRKVVAELPREAARAVA